VSLLDELLRGGEVVIDKIANYLRDEADYLLNHSCRTIPAETLQAPSPDYVEKIFVPSDRPTPVLKSLQQLFNTGRLAGTGYLSILPVDQGVEHTAGGSFAPNPIYFDPENIVRLALEGGCNAVASTLGGLGVLARKYAHRIPFILKVNHNELLTYPNKYDQIPYANVEQAFEMGAVAVGATIYFGSEESSRQLQEVTELFYRAHSLGMATVLWAYLRNPAFKVGDTDYHVAADLTGQGNYLGATIEADIVKQKQPETSKGGFQELKFGKTHQKVYDDLTSEHPIDMTRYQVANCFMGRVGLINSGGSSGEDDIGQAVRTAVINKRAGGMGLISGRKAFQKPMQEGVEILNAIQDVYLCRDVTLA